MSQKKAEAIARRMEQVIGAWGQPVRIRRGGVWSLPVFARVSAMSNVVKFAWFRSSESANWDSPAFVVTLAKDGEILGLGDVQIGDAVELPQGIYTIRKLDRPRLSGVVFKTVLYAARDA